MQITLHPKATVLQVTVMTAHPRARHHLTTTAAIKFSRRNAYFRASHGLPTASLRSLFERPRLITVKQLNTIVYVIIATAVMTTVIR